MNDHGEQRTKKRNKIPKIKKERARTSCVQLPLSYKQTKQNNQINKQKKI